MQKYLPITVAIPTYRRCKSVVLLVNEIINQLNEEDELLVIDDCSQDGTTELLKDIPQIRLISNSTNQGMVKTWNNCFKSASHDWVCIVHDDDTIAPTALKTIRRACALRPEPVLIGHSNLGIEFDQSFRYRVVDPGTWAVLNSLLIPSGVTIHKDIVNSLGSFDEQFTYSPDLEYFARVCAKYTLIFIENPKILSFNLHSQNYEYKTWCKPDFFCQLEKIEKLVASYAGVNEDMASQFFQSRMNQHISHILRHSSGSENKFLLKEVSRVIRNKPYVKRRNRIKAYIASLLNWYPRF